MRNIRPLVSSYPDEYATSGLGSDGRGSIVSASSYEHSSLSASETQLFCMTSERFCVHKDTVHCRKAVYWRTLDPELRCAWTQCVSYTMIRARFDVRWLINSLSVDVYIYTVELHWKHMMHEEELKMTKCGDFVNNQSESLCNAFTSVWYDHVLHKSTFSIYTENKSSY